MTDTEHDRLKMTYKKEKDPHIRSRILAVHMVCVLNKSVDATAEITMQCPEWVTKWVQRYREGGTEALADLPRSGRPSAISHNNMNCIMKEARQYKTTPVMLQQKIQHDYGVSYHVTHVRNLMHRYNMSPKISQLLHVNHATVSQVRSWQYRLNEVISCIKPMVLQFV